MKATLFLTALLGASLAVGHAEETGETEGTDEAEGTEAATVTEVTEETAVTTQTDYKEYVDESWNSATDYNTLGGKTITSAWSHHVSLYVYNGGTGAADSATDTNSVSVGSADSLINASSGTTVGDILFASANDTDVTYVTDWYTYSTAKVSSTTSRDNNDTAFGSNTTRTSATFIVQNGTVVFDGTEIHAYDSSGSTSATSELSDIQMNLSIGTTYGQTGTLTLTNGTVLETTAIFSVIGGEGGTGIVNVDGATLKTQQITLGSSASVQSLGSYGLSTGSKYITYYNEYLHSYDQFMDLISGGTLAEMSYGIINITNGGAMTVAEGNDSYSSSTNQLQIQNGEINVSGTGSTFTYAPMDYTDDDDNTHATGNLIFGKVDNGYGSGDFQASINVTDGGTATFDCQNVYLASGFEYNLEDSTENVSITASGTDENGTASTVSIAAEATMYIGYTQGTSEELLLTEANVDVLAENGGQVNISSDSDIMLGGGTDVDATVTMRSTGEGSALKLASASAIVIDETATGDTVTFGASESGATTVSASSIENYGTASVKATSSGTTTVNADSIVNRGTADVTATSSGTTTVSGAVDNYGETTISATGGGTVSIAKYTNEEGASTTITTAQAESADGATSSGAVSIGEYWNYGETTLALDSAADVAVAELHLVSGSWTMTTTDDATPTLTLGEVSQTYFYVSGDTADTATATAITASNSATVAVTSGAQLTLVISSSELTTLAEGETNSLDIVLISTASLDTLVIDDESATLASMTYLDSAGNTLTISDAALYTTTNEESGATELHWTGTITSSSLTVVVPEPATATLGLLSLVALAARKRRK